MRKIFAAVVVGVAPVLCAAVFPDQGTTSFRSVGMIGTRSGSVFSIKGSGVAISPDWVIGVAHVGGTEFIQAGITYPIEKKLFHKSVSEGVEAADLALFKLAKPVPSFSPILLAPFDAPSGQIRLRGRTVYVAGWGRTATLRADGLGWSSTPGSEGKALRWATNRLDLNRELRYNLGTEEAPKWRTQQCIAYDLDKIGDESFSTLGTGATAKEGGQATRDSGGGWFVQIDGQFKLVGVSATIGVPEGSTLTSPYQFGALGFAVHLEPYREWLHATTGLAGFSMQRSARPESEVGLLAAIVRFREVQLG